MSRPPAPPPAFPDRILLEPTNECDFSCPSCPRRKMVRPEGRMDERLFREIANECAAHPVRLWLHFMGEPMLHPGIFTLVRAAKEAGIRQVGLSTNALHLDGTARRAVFESGLDRIECTLDSVDRAGFLRMRGRDAYDEVASNVQALLEEKRRRGAHTPVVSLQFLNVPPASSIHAEAVALWKPRLVDGDFLMGIPDHSFAGRVRAPRPREGRTPCAWLRSSIVILWDGSVVACPADYDGERVMGRIGEQSIASIWGSTAYADLRARHDAEEYRGLLLCEGCDDWQRSTGEGYVNLLREPPR